MALSIIGFGLFGLVWLVAIIGLRDCLKSVFRHVSASSKPLNAHPCNAAGLFQTLA